MSEHNTNPASLDVPDPSTLADRAIARGLDCAQRLEAAERERAKMEHAYCVAITEMLRAVQEARHARDDARDALCALLDALGSSRDDVRIEAVAEAMETRRGWGL